MGNLVLSVFPGIDLLGRAFEEEGFCIVRGPDVLWGGDIRTFHPPAGVFDGVIGGPPCQHWTRMAPLIKHNGYELAPDLIPEYERIVSEAAPAWFVMEEVPDAPLPQIKGYVVESGVFNNRQFGAVQNRERRLSVGCRGRCPGVLRSLVDWQPINGEWAHAVTASAGGRPVPIKIGGNGKEKKTHRMAPRPEGKGDLTRAVRLQGLPDGFLEEAPFTKSGKMLVIGNGVPLPMGRAIAHAVKRAFYETGVTDATP